MVNDEAVYDEEADNLFSTDVTMGSIFDSNTEIVNLTDGNLNTLRQIATP